MPLNAEDFIPETKQAAPTPLTAQQGSMDVRGETETPSLPNPSVPASMVPKNVPQAELPTTELKANDFIPAPKFDAHVIPQLRQIAPPVQGQINQIETKKQGDDLYSKLTSAVGTGLYQAGTGLIAGPTKVADSLNAVAQSPFRLAGQISNQPLKTYQSPLTAYENTLTPGTTQSIPYNVAKMAGEGLSYAGLAMIPGVAEAGAAMKIGPRLLPFAEGAMFGGAESARQQLTDTNKINPAQVAQDMAGSAALGGAAHYGLKAAGNLIGKMKGPKVSATADATAESAAAAAAPEAGQAAVSNPPATLPAEQAEGAYRLLKNGVKGYEHLDGAKSIDELKGILSPKQIKKLREAMDNILGAYAHMKILADREYQTAMNALKLATTESQKARVKVQRTTKLGSEAREKLDKLKSDLMLKQQQGEKDALQNRKDQLQGALKTVPPAAQGAILKELAVIEEAIRKAMLPQGVFDIPHEKHLRAMLDESEILFPHTDLSKTYKGAIQQAQEATKLAKAAQKQYDVLKAHYLDEFEAAEKQLQKHFGNLDRIWLKHGVAVSDKQGNSKTTQAAIGLQHNPYVAQLNAIFNKELKEAEKVFAAEEKNIRESTKFSAPTTGGAGTKETLKKAGILNPVAEKLMLSASLGLTALDVPANAADGNEEKDNHNLAKLGIALTASILAARHGPTLARQIMKHPTWIFNRYYANTRDLAKAADGHMKKTFDDALSYRMAKLVGRALQTQIFSPDEPTKMVDAMFHGGDISALSPAGQVLAQDMKKEIKDFRKFAGVYAKQWGKHYRSLSASEQNILSPVNGAINFVAGAIKAQEHDNFADKAFNKLVGNAARAWFELNPSQHIANTMDLALTGPLQLGPVSTIKGYLLYATNPSIRKLTDELHLSGSRSQGLAQSGISSKAASISSERLNARVLTVASLYDYTQKNPNVMKQLKLTEEAFIKHVLNGRIDPDVGLDALSKLGVDTTEALGYDYLNLNKGPLSRSMLGNFVKFASQPERFARLLVTAGAKGNWGGIAMSLFILQQFAGQAAVPKTFQLVGWAIDPASTAKVLMLLNAMSIGQHTLGDMSRKVDYDPIAYPLMGVMAPGFDNVVQMGDEMTKSMNDIAEVIGAAKHPKRLYGDKRVEENKKTQKAVRSIINTISMFQPSVSGVPLQAVSAFAYNIPDVIHNLHEISVPQPGFGGSAFPLEQSKVKSYKGAKEDAIRSAARLAPSYGTTEYKLAETALKLGKGKLTHQEEREFNKVLDATGRR